MPDQVSGMSLCHAVVLLLALLDGVRGWNDRGLYPTKDDPLGDKDLFMSLTERQKQRWATPHEIGSESKLRKINSLEISTSIDIHLVGFSGEGNLGLNVGEGDVAKYVNALKKEPWGHVLNGKPHHLNVKHKYFVNVVVASSQLHDELFNAIRQAMPEEGKAEPVSTLSSIPHRVVEKLLDGATSSTHEAYTIYVLNLHPQDRSYAYTYGEETSHPCLGSSYAAKGRYFWVDLTAGPLAYGPSMSGEGLVGPRTFPSLSTYTGDQHHKAFLADLVAMLWNGVQHLVAPPLDHTPREFAAETTVHLVYIQGLTPSPLEKEWDAVVKELLSTEEHEKLRIGSQVLKFTSSKVELHSCSTCSAALARATKTYTAGTRSTSFLTGHEFLDSKELHHLLASFYPRMKEAGGLGQSAGEAGSRVVPVFVFDVGEGTAPILLDRFYQAVAFDDMVVAVRNKARPIQHSTFTCNQQVPPPTQDMTRPLMASILQTVWNVAPTHLGWSDARNRSVEDYRWSVGQTPFGPLSGVSSLSFAQRDAALRNTILAELNSTFGDVRTLLEAVQEFGGEDLVMSSGKMKQYNARFNFLFQKLEKGLQALAAFNWDNALFFIRSARHDVRAMRVIAEEGAHELHTSLSCFNEPPTSSWWYLVFPFAGMLTFAIFNKSSILKSKSKRF